MSKLYRTRHHRIARGRWLAGRGRLPASTGAVAGNRGQETADDRGQSVAEIATDLVISAVVLSTLVLLVSWVSQVFAGSATGGILETVRPERTVQRELSRLADRMLVARKCVNPNVHIPGETRLSQCLQFEDTAKYPSPQNPPGLWKYKDDSKEWTRIATTQTWYTTGDIVDISDIDDFVPPVANVLKTFPQPSKTVSDAAKLLTPLCWVTLREDTDNTATPAGADQNNANSDQRVLECWYLEQKLSPSNGSSDGDNLYQLNIGFHKPAKTVPKSIALKTDQPEQPTPPYNIGYESTTPVDGDKVTQETSDILEPLWQFTPYRTLTLIDRVMISGAASQTPDNQQDWQCTILKLNAAGNNDAVDTQDCSDAPNPSPTPCTAPSLGALPFHPTATPLTPPPCLKHERGVIALSLKLCIAFTQNELERGLGSLPTELPAPAQGATQDETRCDESLSYLVTLYASPGRE